MRSDDGIPQLRTRRDFIRRASCAAVGTLALSGTIRDLRLINSAMAQSNMSGYKALVCVFLNGGNDANNWIIPTDAATYAQYAALRGNLAIPSQALDTLKNGSTPYTDDDGHQYAFHPNCPELGTLFNENKLGIVFNVGTLIRPITRAEYLSDAVGALPPQLFSHSDQITQWQTSIPDRPPVNGWGGRVADLLSGSSTSGISMSISLAGSNTFQIGNAVSQYQVSPSGAVALGGDLMTGPTGTRGAALQQILGLSHPNLQRTAYAQVMQNAIQAGVTLNSSISGTANHNWNPAFPNTDLGNQLKMVARIIHGRTALDASRQIFFCSVGGYDTHGAQVSLNPLDPTTGVHADLLNELSESLFAFQRAMEQFGVSNNVTTFTASDFSRTFPSNSQGSDHGWGSHHIVMGGAVQGGRAYGHLPTLALDGPDDTEAGRWIPTLSVDQYSATLAKWFGVDTGNNMNMVFPNLTRFGNPYLNFMV